jgi:hypothetical protein
MRQTKSCKQLVPGSFIPDQRNHASNREVTGRGVDDITDEANSATFGEFDQDHVVGDHAYRGRMCSVMHDRVAEDAPVGRSIDPIRFGRLASGTKRCRRVPEPPTIAALLETEAPCVAAVPKFAVVQRRGDGREARRKVRNFQTLPRIMALVGATAGPLVTRHVCAFATCEVDTPRI